MNQVKVGKFICELRKENNMTQEQLAEVLRVSNKSISRWENGNTMPDISLMLELSEILKITLPELINGRRMTKEELLAQKETIENLIEIESNKQIDYYKKATLISTLGSLLLLLGIAEENVNFLKYIFTPNAAKFVLGLIFGLSLVFNVISILNLNRTNDIHKKNIRNFKRDDK